MNIAGQYRATTIEKIAAGQVFSSSVYGSGGAAPISYVGLKAVSGQKPGVVVFNGPAVRSIEKDINPDTVSPCFYYEAAFPDGDVLDITSAVLLQPDLKSIASRNALYEDTPNGTLVFLDNAVFMGAYLRQERFHGYHVLYVNVMTGEARDLTAEERMRACVCLKWDLLIHAGTPSQKVLYHYDWYATKTGQQAAA